MAYCTQCGKEIPEGSVCDCMIAKENPEQKKTNKRINFRLILICLAAVVVVVLGLWIFSSVNAYKRPIKAFAKGINRHDTELLIESVLSDGNIERMKAQIENSGKSWKEYAKENNKKLKKELKNNDFKKIKFEITDKEKVKGDELNLVKGMFTIMDDSEISKVCKVYADMTIKTKDHEKTSDVIFYVVKVKGEDWKCIPYGIDIGFSLSNYTGF